MTHQVALSFEDGVTRFVDCEPHETVAEASYKARINIPVDCRDGACGTCKSLCEYGDYDGGDYIEDALTDEEAARGYALPCQMTPHSDLVLRIPGTSEGAKTGAARHAATVTGVRHLSTSTVECTLELEDRSALTFLPGQYVNMNVPGTDRKRSYSFSSGPDDQHVSFLVRITEGGLMSEYLRDRAQPGDEVELTGPMGSFFLREPRRPVLLLAGGTGLSPLLSMLEQLTTGGCERPVRLIYGVSADRDLVELDKLDHYASVLPDFAYEYCVSDPDSPAPGKGYVTDHFEDRHFHGGDVDVYLCGPPPMVEAVRGHLGSVGITPANFFYEKFNVAAAAESEPEMSASR